MSRTTQATGFVPASPSEVYRAFIDPAVFASWLPPEGMRANVHVFEPREGGRIGMSLTYDDPASGPGGKTTEDTDTFAGRFAELVPDRRIVHVAEFESDRPDLAGAMRITWELSAARGGTQVACTCEDIPSGISLEDNEAGTISSLENLAAIFAR